MRYRKRLGDVEASARVRLLRLRATVDGVSQKPRREQDLLCAFAAIETANTWSSFCRSMYLSLALGCRDAKGSVIASAAGPFRTVDDALGFVIAQLRPDVTKTMGPWQPREEPDWNSKAVFVRAIQLLGPANEASLVGALRGRSRALEYLPRTRNFYAHRGIVSAKRVDEVARLYLIPPPVHFTDVMTAFGPRRQQEVICDWIDEVYGIVDHMV